MLISIRGLYKWDPTIFDGFHVPVGMNKLHAVADILFNCAELSVVYPDPDFMAEAIALWSDIELANWERAWNALQLEYNPIWNVDATILETEERDLEGTEGRTLTHEAENGETINRDLTRGVSTEESGTDGNTRTLNTTRTDDLTEDEETINSVSGFNATASVESDRQNREKTNTGTVADTGTVTDDGTSTNEVTTDETVGEDTTREVNENATDTESKSTTDTGTITRETKRQGNIGVVTSQSMVLEELKVAEANIYKTITNSFKRRFCIQVY